MAARRTDTGRVLGHFIVADPSICHGKPTFRGTRILVSDVLEQVASGLSWDAIAKEWRGSVLKAAIAEAVRLASQALVDHAVQPASPVTTPERAHV
jgi:uncharacterized protein (DUF433 family)